MRVQHRISTRPDPESKDDCGNREVHRRQFSLHELKYFAQPTLPIPVSGRRKYDTLTFIESFCDELGLEEKVREPLTDSR